MTKHHWLGLFFSLALLTACGDDDADALGIGAQCAETEECDGSDGQSCLANFKGGYCGLAACTADIDCPDNSACVTHDDDVNYCFRICNDKAQCNSNRDVENEANCSSSVDFVETQTSDVKACVPPSN